MSEDDPFEGLDEDQYIPPESDVDPDEHLPDEDELEEEDEERIEEEPAAEEAEPEPDEDEPGDELVEGAEEPEPAPAAGEPESPTPDADAGEDDEFANLDEGGYLPPEHDVDPDEHLPDEDEVPEEPEAEAVPAGPPPGPDEPADEPEPAPLDEAEPEEHEAEESGGRTRERPPEEDLRVEDVIDEPDEEGEVVGEVPDEDLAVGDVLGDEEEPPEETAEEPPDEEPVAPVAPGTEDETEEGPLPAGPGGAGDGEPADEPEPAPLDEAEGEEHEADEEPPEEPPETPPPTPDVGAASREPEAPDPEPEPSLPGAGSVLVAETLDGLGSRRVAWTLAGAALALLGAAYWRGLSQTGWMLRAAFLFTPTLLLPAFLISFPLERRTGQDRIMATYPPGPGRFLLGRYLAYLVLGLAYLLVALAVAGPVAYYAGPHWVNQLPIHLGAGFLVVAATASLGVLLGTLAGRVGSRAAGTRGLVVGALLYVAPQGVYYAESALGGTGYGWLAVRLLHLSPATAATSLLLDAQVFPVEATAGVEAAVLPLLALVFGALGALAYTWLQGPGGWRAHPVVRLLFLGLVVAALAAPAALPMDLGRGDPIVERTRSSSLDVTVEAEQDLRGASGGPSVDGALTQGVAYDGFLTVTFARETTTTNRTLTDVTVDVRSEVLGVDASDDLDEVTVPASNRSRARVPVDVPVTVRSIPGAYDPAPATAFVEISSDQADFTVVVDDLETATVRSEVVRWLPAAAAGVIVLVQGIVLVAARRRL